MRGQRPWIKSDYGELRQLYVKRRRGRATAEGRFLLTTFQIEQCAAALLQAQRTRKTINVLTQTYPDLSEAQAYDIQSATLLIRTARHVGFKLGYTSAAMRQQMNIDQPNYGTLTDDMRLDPGDPLVKSAELIHPLVEPEIALLVGRQIEGVGHDRASIWQHVDAVMPAIEIVDTRYHEYKFAQADNISDNSSSARLLTGTPRQCAGIDEARRVAVELRADGCAIDHGVGANALEDPILALLWLAHFFGRRGHAIAEGSIVLTGGLTRAYPVRQGQSIEAEFGELGTVSMRFV